MFIMFKKGINTVDSERISDHKIKISLDDLMQFCEIKCNINFRKNEHFARYTKRWNRLKRLMRKKNLTEEQALQILEKKIHTKAIRCLYGAIKTGTPMVVLNRLPCYKQWYFAKLIDHLIRVGLIKAYYTGPSAEELKKSEKCGVRGVPKDPWLKDRIKSAEFKIWSFYTTGDETLRKNRLKCWAKYIELDLTGLLNALKLAESSTIITDSIDNEGVKE